jgi:hypothetical protein
LTSPGRIRQGAWTAKVNWGILTRMLFPGPGYGSDSSDIQVSQSLQARERKGCTRAKLIAEDCVSLFTGLRSIDVRGALWKFLIDPDHGGSSFRRFVIAGKHCRNEWRERYLQTLETTLIPLNLHMEILGDALWNVSCFVHRTPPRRLLTCRRPLQLPPYRGGSSVQHTKSWNKKLVGMQ